jgi:AcrR family transcriptional regulator
MDPTGERICDATLRCVARWGVAKTTLEDVAREAGVGRATIYRTFQGGKGHVMQAVLVREAARFLTGVDAAIDEAGSDAPLEDVIVAGVTSAAGQLDRHDALRFLLAHEPEVVLPHVAFGRLGELFDAVAAFAGPHLARHLPDPDERARAAEWLARVVLTYVFDPADGVDLTDPVAARRLVRTFVMPGLVAGAGTPDDVRTASRMRPDPRGAAALRPQAEPSPTPAPAGPDAGAAGGHAAEMPKTASARPPRQETRP